MALSTDRGRVAVRAWCTFSHGALIFKPSSFSRSELPCESGALRGNAREFAELPCERGALFFRAGFWAFSKGSSGARVVHFAGVHGAPVREWCTFFKRRFLSIFERELRCESGALHGSARSSRARVVHCFLGQVFEHFRKGAPVREWCTSREFTELPCETGALFLRAGLWAFSKGACAAAFPDQSLRQSLLGRFGRTLKIAYKIALTKVWMRLYRSL